MINLEVTIPNQNVTLSTEAYTGSRDYEKLMNKPRLNGKEMIGDVQEEDPTVPSWAKSAWKPTYNAQEVGAVGTNDAITLAEINDMFNRVFG